MKFDVVHFSVYNIMLDLFFGMNTTLAAYTIYANKNLAKYDSFKNVIDLEIKIYRELFMNYSNIS